MVPEPMTTTLRTVELLETEIPWSDAESAPSMTTRRFRIVALSPVM